MTAAIATIGHNNPPEPTPFDLAESSILGLFDEAKHWLDGEGVNSEADANGVSKLLDMIRKAKKVADEARAEEKRPHDEAAKEVQEKYKPLLTRCDLASDACKKALAPWLEKLEAEKRAKAEAARKEADEKARIAQEAIRAAQATDLAAREEAEALIKEAKRAEVAATRAENDKAHAKGGARAVTLRTTYRPTLTNGVEAARHYWAVRREECEAFFLSLAEKDVRAGKHTIPGFDVVEEKAAV
ncbi:hypothetical protein [Microvirga alba]|uniref:Uncharacterized protein n=1 Tax=Microvirga alba TaxID=2791025 RepID=A0A931BRL4_9HYPH|nr:hypothetical protein [Microvirga alba]MBF9233955.1 hypothetical protein [Microvirga alba]